MVPPLSTAIIRDTAEKVRELVECPEGSFPIMAVIEALASPDGDNPSSIEMEILPDSSMHDEYATYCPTTNTLCIRESVYNGACAGNGRDRFTLAHELGHILLHRRGYSFARADVEVPAYRDPEWQANTFASMLLLPRDQIKGMSAEKAAEVYETSTQAAQIALKS